MLVFQKIWAKNAFLKLFSFCKTSVQTRYAGLVARILFLKGTKKFTQMTFVKKDYCFFWILSGEFLLNHHHSTVFGKIEGEGDLDAVYLSYGKKKRKIFPNSLKVRRWRNCTPGIKKNKIVSVASPPDFGSKFLRL